jgi:hypothetical protein
MKYTYHANYRGPGFCWFTIPLPFGLRGVAVHINWGRYWRRSRLWFSRVSKYAG